MLINLMNKKVKIKTKKALYKSTYKGYVFNRNKTYEIESEDKEF